MSEYLSAEVMTALLQVIMIDLVLAGDNAIVIGLVAGGLAKEQRAKVILIGIAAATLLRIAFALVTTQLLQIVGLLLVGGLLLFWVSWKMFRELRHDNGGDHPAADAMEDFDINPDGTVTGRMSGGRGRGARVTFGQAALQIVIADVSMSLDNVLAVAGAAREHPGVLVIGLVLSIAMMGLAASYIANLLQRWRWIAYAGLAVIVYVAVDMTYRGVVEVAGFAV